MIWIKTTMQQGARMLWVPLLSTKNLIIGDVVTTKTFVYLHLPTMCGGIRTAATATAKSIIFFTQSSIRWL